MCHKNTTVFSIYIHKFHFKRDYKYLYSLKFVTDILIYN